MKKTLLLASAAVLFAGAANAAAPAKGLELGIEGYASVYGVYAHQDSAGKDRAEFNLKKEMSVDLTGSVELENGLKVGASIETLTKPTNGLDNYEKESYIFVEGGFGKVIVGQEYNAAYLMQVAAPAVDAEIDGMDPTYNVISVGSNRVSDQSYAMYGDGNRNVAGAEKLTVISPVWGGFQAGFSYTPEVNTVNSRGAMTSELNEAYSLAARYGFEAAGADFTIGAGYNKLTSAGSKENYEWNVGVNSVFDGAWDLGVAYHEKENEISDQKVKAVAAGVNYTEGELTYGVSYMFKENELQSSKSDELNRWMAGVRYAYGPGMSLNGSVSYNDYSSHAGSANENDATVIAVGTVINF